jgi:uncharacterized protein involved in outer membrane biogenesis
MNREVGKYASVERNARALQTIDQATVGQSIGSGLRIDSRNPQRSKLTLALTTVAIRVLTRFCNRLLGNSKNTRTRTVVALGLL